MTIDYTKYDVVFCDSYEALENAYNNGLKRDAIIKTASPFILWKKDINTWNVDNAWPVEKAREFHQSTEPFLKDLFEAVYSLGEFKEYALLISRMGINYQRFVYKAGCLNSEDFTKKRLFLKVHTKETDLNTPWDYLLKSNPHFEVHEYLEKSVTKTEFANYASWLERIKLGGMEALIFRFSNWINKYLPSFLNQKHFYVLRENELLIDTSAGLFKKGVVTSFLSPVKPKKIEDVQHDFSKLENALRPVLMKRFSSYLPREADEACFLKFFDIAVESVKEQDRFSQIWANTLPKLQHKKMAVGSNAPHRANQIALSLECQKRGIPFIGFQHGVTHEIFNDFHYQKPYYEANISDIALTFNDEMTAIGSSTYTKRGKCITVGISKRYIRASNIKKSNEVFPPIAYISCNLPTGNSSPVYNHMGDFDKTLLEKEDLLALNKIPHKVLFKTYPFYGRRYTDPDPLLPEVKSLSNIVLYDQMIDLRYLLGNFQIIIATQASSTLSWIMFSGKPVVFLDNQSVCGLRPEIYDEFNEAVFLFSRTEENMRERLVSFLSRPIKDIENEWNSEPMKEARQKVLKKYFSARIEGSGSKAASVLCDEYFNKI